MSEIAFACFCNRRFNVSGVHRLRGTLTQSLNSGSAWPTRIWRAIRGNRWLGSARLIHALSCCCKYWIAVKEPNLRFAILGKPYYLLLCIPIVVPYFKLMQPRTATRRLAQSLTLRLFLACVPSQHHGYPVGSMETIGIVWGLGLRV